MRSFAVALILSLCALAGAEAKHTLLAGAGRQRRQQQRERQRSGRRSKEETKEKSTSGAVHSQKFIFTTMAIGAAVIGAYQTGDNVYKIVDAARQKRRYKKGLEEAVEYALSEDFDPDGNNQAIVAIMSAYQH